MRRKERLKLSVFERLKDNGLSWREASEMLGLSLRQVHRAYRRYLAEGDKGPVHRSRGKASPRRVDALERERALKLYRWTYRSYGPTLLAEKLGPHPPVPSPPRQRRRTGRADGIFRLSAKVADEASSGGSEVAIPAQFHNSSLLRSVDISGFGGEPIFIASKRVTLSLRYNTARLTRPPFAPGGSGASAPRG